MISALRNQCRVWWWQDFENRSTFAEVTGKIKGGVFWNTV